VDVWHNRIRKVSTCDSSAGRIQAAGAESSTSFGWGPINGKPEDLDEIDRSTPLDTAAVKRRIRAVDTFQLDELRLLNRYATPIERLYLLLGLNCGFGTKEIATLTIGEIFLHQALPAGQMSQLGTSLLDTQSIKLFEDWIRSLEP